MNITIKGTPAVTQGTFPKINDAAPTFRIKDINGDEITLESLKGQVALISTFPDIDTRICDLQTRKFFELAADIKDVKIINLSNNDPKNLTAWCATNGIDTLMAVDIDNNFAMNYGIWIDSIQHLARAVFIIDQDGNLAHAELITELSSEPNYDAALEATKNL